MIIEGTSAAETLEGTGSDDQIDGKGGLDTILAGGSNDTIAFSVVALGPSGAVLVDGGAGTDTIMLSAFPRPTGQTFYRADTIRNIEKLAFSGSAADQIFFTTTFTVPDAASGVVRVPLALNVAGSAGSDVLQLKITGGMGGASAIALPNITFQDWHSDLAAGQTGRYDYFTTFATDGANYTLMTSEFVARQGIYQTLLTGSGNDVLMGSSGRDFLDGGSGINRLFGKAGNDSFFLDGDTTYSPASLYDGGDGIDTLDISGEVTFAGRLRSIEAITLNPDPTTLTMTAKQAQQLPADLILDGQGVLAITNAAAFSAANFTFAAGAAVATRISGTTGANQLTGSSSNDTLLGKAGDDGLSGGASDDVLSGGHGRDVLTGGTGADRFVFDTSPYAASNSDTVTDFDVAAGDTIAFAGRLFRTPTSSGKMLAESFYAAAEATQAHDASDRIVYDTSTGNLYADIDGTGSRAAVVIATFTGAPVLTLDDFVIFV